MDYPTRDYDDELTYLYSTYGNEVLHLAAKFFENRYDQEDIVQETFLRVFLNLGRIDDQKNIKNWVYRIATNLCIDTLRKRAVRFPTTAKFVGKEGAIDLLELIPAQDSSPEESAINNEIRGLLVQKISSLPSKWMMIMYQYYILEMSFTEISMANNLSLSTTKSRFYRARTYLQRSFRHLK